MRLIQIPGHRPADRQRGDGPRTLRVFVTGATGYVGGAIVRAFAEAGHEVTGMTRWAESTLAVRALGGRAVVGDLLDSNSYRRLAAGHDILVHAAAVPAPRKTLADRAAIDVLLWAAAQQPDRRKKDPPRVVIYTSGCFVLGDTGDAPAAEDAALRPPEVVAWRPEHERLVLDAGSDAVTMAVIRPGMVYGGRGGHVGEMFASADATGEATFIGTGANRWSLVHRDDLAELYRQVAERRAGGVFHAADGSPLTVREIARLAAEAAGRDGRVRALPLDEARRERGGLADALCMDQVMACPRAAELGWTPSRRSFEDEASRAWTEWRSAGP